MNIEFTRFVVLYMLNNNETFVLSVKGITNVLNYMFRKDKNTTVTACKLPVVSFHN